MTELIPVERAHWREADGLAHVIAEAFHELPPSEWLVPDPVTRHEVLPGYFRILVDEAMTGGAVYVSTDRHAVAVWLRITHGLTTPTDDYENRLVAACGEHVSRFRLFDKALEQRHPKSAAHHYLALLAVRPEYQARGYGTALLRSYHSFLDREQAPAYLEAASPRLRDWYARHGYAQMGGALDLPGGPLMWPMWRPARRPSTGTVVTEAGEGSS